MREREKQRDKERVCVRVRDIYRESIREREKETGCVRERERE